jgi:hypothetical protein
MIAEFGELRILFHAHVHSAYTRRLYDIYHLPTKSDVIRWFMRD